MKKSEDNSFAEACRKADEKQRHKRGDPAPDDDAEIERLAKLSMFEYERQRKAAAEKFDLRSSILDRLTAAKRAELGLDGDGRQGRQFDFAQIEPWSAAVDGGELLNEITATIRKHVIMPPHAAEAIALWVVHTHLVRALSDLAAIGAAERDQTVREDDDARYPGAAGAPGPADSERELRPPSFAMVEAHQPCLLVDEADTFLKDNEELRGIINSGHRQGGCVLRVEGDQHETRAFATYAPCAIAAIGSLPGTIMDRSVVIDLARRKPDEKIEAFRLDRTAALDEITRRIVRWAADNAEAVSARDPEMPPGLYNRNADNWRPLFQIADVAAGSDWPQRARAAALSGAPDLDEVSLLELLLGDIQDILDALPSDLLDQGAADRLGRDDREAVRDRAAAVVGVRQEDRQGDHSEPTRPPAQAAGHCAAEYPQRQRCRPWLLPAPVRRGV